MRKYLQKRGHSYANVEENEPGGCIWTLLRILHYHPWRNVKKMLPYKKRTWGGERNRTLHNRNEKRRQDSGTIKAKELVDGIVDSVESSYSCSSSISKRFKARIKSLITTEDHISKQDSSSPSHHRIDSNNIIHSPSMTLQDFLALKARAKLISSSTETIKATSTKQSQMSSSSTCPTLKDLMKDDYADIHELFEGNKKLFLDILGDQSDATLLIQLLGNDEKATDHQRRKTNIRARLIKSGSYPSPNCSSRMGLMHMSTPHNSKLEYKHNEVWPSKLQEEHLRCKSGRKHGTSMTMMMRRTLSLNESMDKYSQLFDLSSNSKREMIKSQYLSSSRSLKLSDNYENDLYFDSGELVNATKSQRSTRSLVSDQFDQCLCSTLLHNEDASGPLQEEEINTVKALYEDDNNNNSMSSSSELLETCFHQDQVGIPATETIVMISGPDHSKLILHDNTTIDLSCTSQPSLVKKDDSNTSCNTGTAEFDPEYQYVKYILELYGFTNKYHLRSWYSLDQPLNPTFFHQVEAICPLRLEQRHSSPNCHGGDTNCSGIMSTSSNRKILFDLINEGLTVAVYGRSYTYSNYSKSLSFSSGIHHAVPLGDRVIEEVWRFVCRYLKWTKPEGGSLIWDSIAAYDLYKNDYGWMDLQMESESVGLVVEEIIFDELLDEVFPY